ncbi:MAG TPA: IS1380 family transposase [Caulobacteraceae bacterium]|nr:IS1380 family transposase [Caulobacteraceae bacterium]
MDDDTGLLFDLPSVGRKKVSAAFDGGRITSDGGVALLALADRRIGIVDRIARLIADRRDPALVTHSLASIIRARVLAIACGYEDANDLDRLRGDPAFKLACGRLPDSGGDLCSQPTVSRWENAPDLKTIIQLTYAMVDAWCASYDREPEAVTLDIDDTLDVVHGGQQLSLFHAHHDARCFLPIHIYDTATGRPVAVILRPGKTPSGREAAGYLRRLHRRIRCHWPTTRLTIRGDGHYGRPEMMDFCDRHGLDYLFGVTGTKALAAKVEDVADPIRVERARTSAAAVRGFAETRYKAGTWKKERRLVARIEATPLGLDIRYVVTSLETPSAEHIYARLYCARGQAENLIKLHKAQLGSDRTSCRSPLANQMRLILHTAAYWLMLTVRDAVPKTHALAKAEFATIRARLLKIGARIRETTHRVRVAFAAACPEADLFRHLAMVLRPLPP